MAQEQSATISQLPTVCLEHILSFCGLRQVFVCMRVSREWRFAARTCIRNHDWHVCIIRTQHCRRLGCSFGYNEVVLNDRTDRRRVMASLSLMSNLSSLYAKGFQHHMLSGVLTANADSLKSVALVSLPSKPSVTYSQLTHLEVDHLTREALKACPKLRLVHVAAQPDMSMIHSLPTETLTTINLKLDLASSEGLPTAVQSLSRLAKLQVFDLEIRAATARDEDSACLVKLFDCYDQLREFSLWCHMDVNEISGDDAVRRLVGKNPLLHHVSFTMLILTDQLLQSLSRLANLRTLDIRSDVTVVTSDGVLTLFRGESRVKLQSVTMFHQQRLDSDLLKWELVCMASETGKIIAESKYDIDTFPDEEGRDVQVCSLYFLLK